MWYAIKLKLCPGVVLYKAAVVILYTVLVIKCGSVLNVPNQMPEIIIITAGSIDRV